MSLGISGFGEVVRHSGLCEFHSCALCREVSHCEHWRRGHDRALPPGLWSRKESEVFGWSGILKTLSVGAVVGFFIRCNLRIFYPTPAVALNHFLHRTPKLGILTRDCWHGTISFETFLKQRILAVYHDFHWLLFGTKLLTAKFYSRYVKESELDVLPPSPQPWLHPWLFKKRGQRVAEVILIAVSQVISRFIKIDF